MKTRIKPGDLVMVSLSGFHHGPFFRGTVISMQPGNCIPDSLIRGLSDPTQWSYWVMLTDKNITTEIVGPLREEDVYLIDQLLPRHLLPA